jgi:Cu-Zn family superoxide dismutase
MRATAILMMILFGAMAGACGNKDDDKAKPKAKDDVKAKPEVKVPVDKADPPPPPVAKTATATLEAKNDSGVSGTVTFIDTDGKVEVEAEVAGLTPGEHGFHVHEKGDCSSPDGKSAGGHFNPKGVDHGKPDAEIKHAGDLGNVTAGDDGKATHTMTTNWLSLGEGDTSIAGRAVILHAKADDFGQPTGNAGGRVACGVITVE